MEKERNFVVFARINEDGKIRTETALLTVQQIDLLHWLYNKDLLNGTFESDNDICIEEP